MVSEACTVPSSTGQSDANAITAMIIRSFSPIGSTNTGMTAEQAAADQFERRLT